MLQFLGRRLVRSFGFQISERASRSPCCVNLMKSPPRLIEDAASVYCVAVTSNRYFLRLKNRCACYREGVCQRLDWIRYSLSTPEGTVHALCHERAFKILDC